MDKQERVVFRVACKFLSTPPVSLERLGGRSRTVWRVLLKDGSTCIAAYRKNRNRAHLEHHVLSALQSKTSLTPRLIRGAGHWTFQSDIGPTRLSETLVGAAPDELETHLLTGLSSLHELHLAGAAAGLNNSVTLLGARMVWVKRLIETPDRIVAMASGTAPKYDKAAILNVIRRINRQFIKWDARPGNAIVNPMGQPAWFDFEHCGVRDPLDDVAWFLGDEYVPHDSESDASIFANHVHALAMGRSLTDAQEYLRVFGLLHMSMRIELILKRKARTGWQDPRKCLANDGMGVSPDIFANLCAKAAYWAKQHVATLSLAPIYLDLPAAVEERSKQVAA
jgi:hypothetical protein